MQYWSSLGFTKKKKHWKVNRQKFHQKCKHLFMKVNVGELHEVDYLYLVFKYKSENTSWSVWS